MNMFKSIWSILGVFMVIPILVVNHAIPEEVMTKGTRTIVVLILLAIQIFSCIIQVIIVKRLIKKKKAELERLKKQNRSFMEDITNF